MVYLANLLLLSIIMILWMCQFISIKPFNVTTFEMHKKYIEVFNAQILMKFRWNLIKICRLHLCIDRILVYYVPPVPSVLTTHEAQCGLIDCNEKQQTVSIFMKSEDMRLIKRFHYRRFHYRHCHVYESQQFLILNSLLIFFFYFTNFSFMSSNCFYYAQNVNTNWTHICIVSRLERH